ncbi:MAG: YitT family protein [Terrisporobacter sp.]|uniref:YitT family protein n=1 Tax=Terrisporobacter sp. TaxID=1965305 RepID=UPI002FC6E04E
MSKNSKALIIEILGMIIGCILVSLGINMFFAPHTIAPGGLSGLSVVLSKISGLSVSTIMLMLGIPLVGFSIKILGKKNSIKTLIGMLLLSFCINVTSPFSAITVTDDVLLSAITGAILLGLGLGIVFRVDGSTGGTDLIALMINKAIPSIPLSKCLVFIDGLVVLSSGIVNQNLETGLYSAISLYVIVKMVDFIVAGFDYSKSFMIITNEEDALKDAIVNDMQRGITILEGKGGYTDSNKSVLIVVVRKNQEVHLKKLIKKVDKNAFIIVSDVHEVFGEGFAAINA